MFGHLPEIHERFGPLYAFSAEASEGLYALLNRGFVTGTPNSMKQLLESAYIRQQFVNHQCSTKRNLLISTAIKQRVDDSLIVTNNKAIYKVLCISDSADIVQSVVYKVARLQTEPFSTAFIDLSLPWEKVGLFNVLQVCDEPEEIRETDIVGKVMRVSDTSTFSCHLREWVPRNWN